MKLLDRYSSWFGVFVIGLVLYTGVFKHSANPVLYMNQHAFLLVVIGTMGVSILAYPLSKLVEIFDFVIMGFFFRRKLTSRFDIANELATAVGSYLKNPTIFPYQLQHPFIKEAFYFLNKKDLSAEQLGELLHDRKESVTRKYFDDAKVLVSISKFPPALGLLGASTGMIEMMQQVGGAGGVKEIGQSMAVALVATFWGIGIANFIVLPLSDFALRQAEEAKLTRELIIDVVYLLKQNYSASRIFDHLSSKISLDDRLKLKPIIKRILDEIGEPIEETGTDNISNIKFSEQWKKA